MDNRTVLSLLHSLAQLDIDATYAYRRAVRRMEDGPGRDRLVSFWRDHERHIDELSAAIHRLGGTSPEWERDAKGAMIEGFTALRSGTGDTGALRAMKTNERLTNAAYSAALKEDLPADIRALVERNREDERRHFAFIRAELDRPEHHGVGMRGLLAGAAVAIGAAVAVWAVTRRRGEARGAGSEAPQPEWLVRRARPGMRVSEAASGEDMTHRPDATDFGDEAQHQAPGEPADLALHPRRHLDDARRRAFDEAVKREG